MRAGDLQGLMVRTEDGRRLGRVSEIHLRGDEVSFLACGRTGWLQRFLPAHGGHRVAWDEVRQVTPAEIVIAPRGRR
jgi:sporulation protein YlmC with PRC-barrel domain